MLRSRPVLVRLIGVRELMKTERIFVSLPADQWLTNEENKTKWAIVNAVEDLTRISQCAQTARITGGGRFHPDSCRFDLVAGKRLGGVAGRVEALRQRPPRAAERSGGP